MKDNGQAGTPSPEAVREVTRWLLDMTFSPTPASVLARMSKTLNVKGEALASARRYLLRAAMRDLPQGVWLKPETKEAVCKELRDANTADLKQKNLLSPTGTWLKRR